MTADANAICASGVPYPTAIEIAAQMVAGVANVNRLIAGGISPVAATELARQITAGSFAAHLLALAYWTPSTARVIKDTSGL
jgi:hypothetical protein